MDKISLGYFLWIIFNWGTMLFLPTIIVIIKLHSGSNQPCSGGIQLANICINISWNIYTGWWFQPLWKILVSWDDYSQYMEKWKMFQTTNQSYVYLSSYRSIDLCTHPFLSIHIDPSVNQPNQLSVVSCICVTWHVPSGKRLHSYWTWPSRNSSFTH